MKTIQAILILLSIMVLLAFIGIINENASAKIITVGDDGGADYTTIQAAIDNATDGDTIRVWEGTYREIVLVNKTVSLIGNGSEVAIIRFPGEGTDDVVRITANQVNMSGFGVAGSGDFPDAGIKIVSNSSVISNNNCSNNIGNGIGLEGLSSGNVLTNNTCSNNGYLGIFLDRSNGNTISNNICTDNGYVGIQLDPGSDGNTLTDNTCTDNDGNGIGLDGADGNTLTDNTCTNNGYDGIYLERSGDNTLTSNTCSDGIYGIGLDDGSNDNVLTSNHCSDNAGNGIALENRCSDNTISHNTCPNNVFSGIFLDESDSNTISNNICSDNKYGIHLKKSTDTALKDNEFLGNEKDIHRESSPEDPDDEDDGAGFLPGFELTMILWSMLMCLVCIKKRGDIS